MEAEEYELMDAVEDRMWWYRALHRRLLDALSGVSGRVLDAGCGTGGFLAALRRGRPDVAGLGLEWSPHAAKRAAEKSKTPVARGSVNAMPFGPGQFDAAVSADVLCHGLVDPARALAEMRRVLRPGGRLVINMPAYSWLMSAHDRRVHNVRRTTAPQLIEIMRGAGFTDIKASYWNSLLLPLMVAQRKFVARGGAASSVAPFPPWLDAVLLSATEIERSSALRMPAGGSIIATATRP